MEPEDSRRNPASSITSHTAAASPSLGIRYLISRSSIVRRASGGADVPKRCGLDQPLESARSRRQPVREIHEAGAPLLVLHEGGSLPSREEEGREAAQVGLMAHDRDGLRSEAVQVGHELGMVSRRNEMVGELYFSIRSHELAKDFGCLAGA